MRTHHIVTILVVWQLASLRGFAAANPNTDTFTFATTAQMDHQIDTNRSNARVLCDIILHAQDESLLRYALPVLQRESSTHPSSAPLLAAYGFARYYETGMLSKWTATLPAYVPSAIKKLRVKCDPYYGDQIGYVSLGINRLRRAYHMAPRDPGVLIMYAIARVDANRPLYNAFDGIHRFSAKNIKILTKNLRLERYVIKVANTWRIAWGWYARDLNAYAADGRELKVFNHSEYSKYVQAVYRCFKNARLFDSTDYLANSILFVEDLDFASAGHPGLGLEAVEHAYRYFPNLIHMYPSCKTSYEGEYEHDVHYLESIIAKQHAHHRSATISHTGIKR